MPPDQRRGRISLGYRDYRKDREEGFVIIAIWNIECSENSVENLCNVLFCCSETRRRSNDDQEGSLTGESRILRIAAVVIRAIGPETTGWRSHHRAPPADCLCIARHMRVARWNVNPRAVLPVIHTDWPSSLQDGTLLLILSVSLFSSFAILASPATAFAGANHSILSLFPPCSLRSSVPSSYSLVASPSQSPYCSRSSLRVVRVLQTRVPTREMVNEERDESDPGETYARRRYGVRNWVLRSRTIRHKVI